MSHSQSHDKFATKNAGVLLFAALLIACSLTVGCSSNDKPKPVSSNNQIPVTQPAMPVPPAPVMLAETKPAPKKVVHKKPATVNYTDQASGVTFEYPRRYAIETGNAATQLIQENPIAMNFVQPGGVALAAIELPETSFANTDFSSAFFDVSVNKSLTADQCAEFAVPQPKVVSAKSEPMNSQSTSEPANPNSTPATPVDSTKTASAAPVSAQSTPVSSSSPAQPESSNSKLILGDLELRATEAVSGEGTRQSDSKYFHVFQNGGCYEFALNITTVASEDGMTKHVDRDKVFGRLEQILSTVKIDVVKPDPVAAPSVTAEAPAAAPSESPAQ